MSLRVKIILALLALMGCPAAYGVFSYVQRERFVASVESNLADMRGAQSVLPDDHLEALLAGAHDYFAEAREVSDERLLIALVIFCAIAAFICLMLIRAIVAPLQMALGAASSISVGYFENKIPTDLKGELGELLRVISTLQISMKEKTLCYEQQVYETEQAYFHLESRTQEVKDVNARLEELNASTNTMLDALEQGLFSFDADGACLPIFSKACLSFLGKSPAGRSVFEVLKVGEEERRKLSRVLKLLFSEAQMPPSYEDLLALFPRKIEHAQKLALSLSYLPILNAERRLQSIMVVATDHTAEEVAARLMREREGEALRVLRISGNRNAFTSFFRGMTNYFAEPEESFSDDSSLEKIRRIIHTFKGSASIFYLNNIAEILHQMETRLTGLQTIAEARQEIAAMKQPLDAAIAHARAQIYNILGKDFDRQEMTRTLPLGVLTDVCDQLRALHAEDGLADYYLETLLGEPIRKLLAPFEIGLLELADRYGKRTPSCCYAGENFQIYPEIYAGLFEALSHLARNIVSHAIETPEVRIEQGKAPEISVVIDTQKIVRDGKNWFSVSVRDDGAGIDVEKLRVKMNLPNASVGDVLMSIFNDGISTKEVVDEISGRGVGLSALKAEAERLGGRVTVHSEPHAFTRLGVEVPMVWEPSK